MNKKIYLIIIPMIFGFLFGRCIDSSHAFEQHDALTLYTMSTDEDLTVAWDDTNSTINDYYDFYLWNLGEQAKYLIGQTQAIQVTMKVPRSGLWVLYVRSCDKPQSDPTRECSVYAQSDKLEYAKVKDPATGQFVTGKWMVYGHIASPSEGGVVTTP